MLLFGHEARAAFTATEAYFAISRLVVVFTTTGLGITNALTAQMILHWDGYSTMLLLSNAASNS
ncbi:thiamine pyrophosphate-binding protein [Scytonema hofmannii]|uniref:thiamine pyrophosphate-binding protein n=1 Tax=Scytonema hofmannii TaxID=34078 RepID=UPI00300FC5EC